MAVQLAGGSALEKIGFMWQKAEGEIIFFSVPSVPYVTKTSVEILSCDR